jgi:hypothetical protein
VISYIWQPLNSIIMKDNQKPSLPLKDQSINQDEAIFRTTEWRNLYQEKMQCKDEEILRAFLIPIEDIIEIYDFYKKYTDLNITAVRGYVGHNPLGPNTPNMNMDLLLVPVTAEGKDVLETPPALVLEGGVSQSSIYDFSTLCPPDCDLSSPLYSALNSVLK